MDRNEFIGKLQMCYFGDRNAFEEIVGVYDKQKEVLDKIKKYIKENTEFVHDGDEYGYMEYYNINEDITYFIHHLLELLGVNDGIMD